MQMTADELREVLRVAKAEGAAELRIGDFYVRFGPGAYASDVVSSTPRAPTPTSLWENPSLWPGGAPPKFPTDR